VITSKNGPDRGLLYGEACFETMRVVAGDIFAWQNHEARLRKGLAAFGLSCPDGLFEQCIETVRDVGVDTLVRLTISGGDAPRGLMAAGDRQPQVHIQGWPYHAPNKPLVLQSLEWPLSGMMRIAKFSADYAFTIRLLHQARHAGCLSENEQALFMHEGELLYMETANILLRVDGEWVTPDSEALLPGVVRAALLEAGLVRACRCPADWLQVCDAMAICNSGCFIRPVAVVNGRRLDVHGVHFEPLAAVLRGRPGVPQDFSCV